MKHENQFYLFFFYYFNVATRIFPTMWLHFISLHSAEPDFRAEGDTEQTEKWGMKGEKTRQGCDGEAIEEVLSMCLF